MRYEEYYKIMKEHGIGELYFLYENQECTIGMEFVGLDLYYFVGFGKVSYSSFNFDYAISSRSLPIGKSLQDIWEEIEIISIDGVSESDYDMQTCSCNYIERLNQVGELQWSYFLSKKESFFIQLRYILIGVLILPILSILLPLFNLSDWNILFLSGGCAVIIAIIIMLKDRVIVNYRISTKKIFIFKGIGFETTYNNIRRVKLKKFIFKKNYGTIKLYLKKGFSFNYHLENIPNPEEVYNLIIENMEKNK